VLLQDHFLLQAEEADLPEVALLPDRDGDFDPSGAGANEDVAHELVEPPSLQVEFVQPNGLLLEDCLLAVVFPQLPMLLHLSYLGVHFLLSLHPFLDLHHFIIERLV